MTAGTATPRKARKVWLMFVVAVIFGAVLVSPYLLLDIDSSRLEVTGEAHFAVLVVHVFAAFIALVLGLSSSSRRSVRIGRSTVRSAASTCSPESCPPRSPPSSGSSRASSMIPIGQALGWIVNLILAEALIRRRDRSSRQAE